MSWGAKRGGGLWDSVGHLVRVKLGMGEEGGIPRGAAFPWHIRLYQEQPEERKEELITESENKEG